MPQIELDSAYWQQRKANTLGTAYQAVPGGPSIGEKLGHAGGALLQGFAVDIPAAAMESLTVLWDKIDDVFGYGNDYADEYSLWQSAKAYRLWAAMHTAQQPDVQGSILWDQIPRALGQGAAFAALTFATGGAAAPVIAAGASLGIAQGYDAALEAGATEDQALFRALAGGAIGSIEALPFMKLFGRMSKATGGARGWQNYLVNAARQGRDEAIQESLQTLGENVADILILDQERTVGEIGQAMFESAIVGGVAGAGTSVGVQAVQDVLAMGRAANGIPDADTREPVQARHVELTEGLFGATQPDSFGAAERDALNTTKWHRLSVDQAAARLGEIFTDRGLQRPQTTVAFNEWIDTHPNLDPRSRSILKDAWAQNQKDAYFSENTTEKQRAQYAEQEAAMQEPEEASTEAEPIPDQPAQAAAEPEAQVSQEAPKPDPEQTIDEKFIEETLQGSKDGLQYLAGHIIAEDLMGNPHDDALAAGLTPMGWTHEEIDALGQSLGLDTTSPDVTTTIKKQIISGLKKGYYADPTPIVHEAAAAENPIDTDKLYVVGLYLQSLRAKVKRTFNRLDEEQKAGNVAAAANTQQQIDQINRDLEYTAIAFKNATSRAGQNLVVAQHVVAEEAFDSAQVIEEAEKISGQPLSEERKAWYRGKVQEEQKWAARQEKAEETARVEEEAENIKRARILMEEVQKRQMSEEAATKQLNSALADLQKMGIEVGALGPSGESYGVLLQKYREVAIALANLHKVKQLDDLYNIMRTKVPGISRSEFYRSLRPESRRRKKKKLTQYAATLREMQRQTALTEKIIELIDGTAKPADMRDAPSAEMKQLRKILREVRKTHGKQVAQDEKYARHARTVKELQEFLGLQNESIPLDYNELLAYKRDLTDAKRTKADVYKLTVKMLAGEFDTDRPTRRVRHEAVVQAYAERRRIRKEIREQQLKEKTLTKRELAFQTLLAFKSMMGSGDLSATMRQAWWFAARPTHWGALARATYEGGRAAIDEEYAYGVLLSLKDAEMQSAREAAGLELSEWGAVPIERREEFIASTLAQRVPWIKGSARAMSTTLNLVRVHMFDEFYRKYNPSPEQAKAWADVVNKATGRGTLPPGIAQNAHYVAFAPRFALSRFQTPLTLLKYWNVPSGEAVDKAKSDWTKEERKQARIVRKEIAKDFVGFVGFGLSTLAMLDLSDEIEVGWDPRDADFLKIVHDDTRFDLFAGFAQPARLVARMMLSVADNRGMTDEPSWRVKDPFTLMAQFATYKLSPAITVPVALATKRNVVGVEQSEIETIGRSVAPLWISDMAETVFHYWDESPNRAIKKGAATGVGAFFGISTSTYGNFSRRPSLQKLWNHAQYRPRALRFHEDEPEHLQKLATDRYEAFLASRTMKMAPALRRMPPESAKEYLQDMTKVAQEQAKLVLIYDSPSD